MIGRVTRGTFAYLVPTFALGFVWHLILFKHYYEALAVYRPNIIIPFGFLSMVIQGVIFAWIYQQIFVRRGWVGYAVLGAVLSWSFTTLAAGAKNIMASVPDYMLIESAFTVVQWLVVAPLTGLTVRLTDQ